MRTMPAQAAFVQAGTSVPCGRAGWRQGFELGASPHGTTSATGSSVPREPQTLSTAHASPDASKVGRERQCPASPGNSFDQSNVALAVGFFDQSHLARHMRRSFGVSPGRLRAHSAKNRPYVPETSKTTEG
jgi:hypothetical protein